MSLVYCLIFLEVRSNKKYRFLCQVGVFFSTFFICNIHVIQYHKYLNILTPSFYPL